MSTGFMLIQLKNATPFLNKVKVNYFSSQSIVWDEVEVNRKGSEERIYKTRTGFAGRSLALVQYDLQGGRGLRFYFKSLEV